MPSPYLDIFKKDVTGNPVWIDAVNDPESARILLIRLASVTPGEYFAFDQRRQEIVASLARLDPDAVQS